MHSLATRFRGDGLIVHQFDGLKQQRTPWAPCPQDAGRCRCEAANNVTLEKMCAIRDRISASIIFSDFVGLFTRNRGGVIVDAGVASSATLCSYPMDGYTKAVTCIGRKGACVPGCWREWCDGGSDCRVRSAGPTASGFRYKPYRKLPEMVAEYRRRAADSTTRWPCAGNWYNGSTTCEPYNELVLDARVWERELPTTIVGFWFTDAPGCTSRCAAEALGAHAAFSRRYPSARVPLVKLRLGSPATLEQIR